MRVTTKIPQAVLTAAATLLQQYVPDLTPHNLNAAVIQYRNGENTISPVTKKLTRRECAELLGVSINSINRYIRNGKLKAVNISPRLVRIDPDSIQSLLEHGVPDEEVIVPQCHSKKEVGV